jgi:hypothetical protein
MQSVSELQTPPSYISKYTAFYHKSGSATPTEIIQNLVTILTSLNITSRRVRNNKLKGLFHDVPVQFKIRLWQEQGSGKLIIECQRLGGCSVQFWKLYNSIIQLSEVQQ